MKQLLGIALGMAICVAACKKKDADNTLSQNAWRFNDSLYVITSTAYNKVSDTANYFSAETNKAGSRYGKLIFSFRSYPVSRSYKIVSGKPTDDESVNISVQAGNSYYTATNDGSQLNVDVSNLYVQLVGNGIVVQDNNSGYQTYISVNAFIVR